MLQLHSMGLLVHMQYEQRWSRRHKARGHGHKKNPRQMPRTAFPRTDTLEAKDRNTRDQGHKHKCSPKKKRSSQKFLRRFPQKNVFQKIFQVLHRILTIQKIVLSSSRGQANFWGRPRGQGRLQGLHLWIWVPKILITNCSLLRMNSN